MLRQQEARRLEEQVRANAEQARRNAQIAEEARINAELAEQARLRAQQQHHLSVEKRVEREFRRTFRKLRF